MDRKKTNYKSRLKDYIFQDIVYKKYKKDNSIKLNDFEKFCVEHCVDIDTALKKIEELEIKIKQIQEVIIESTPTNKDLKILRIITEKQ